ncbi:NlpC/P60 family protein [Aurantiacibacter spongiae]|uniref:Peptidoglycan endopeptidase n=1 Tax=Aurantiacibacter spongiae TaxID=2488860 RepID=A0A3N5CRN3_9SPHN|nr:NlpC/P60 family protein [Aurantiacibacter spongiae]RPF71267.1 peptidoglycan endopeptidase [Aurantiacibacter spongiae]
MTPGPEAFAEAARGMTGAPFRWLGRDPRTGLDCLGLVAASLTAIGIAVPPLPRYAARIIAIDRLTALLPQVGLAPATGPDRIGDVLLLQPGPAQYHLAIRASPGTIVHAHAGLRRVTESPAPAPWPIVARWRLS